MGDKEIIEAVATLWISFGGDAEGFDWCKDKIKKKIKELEKKKETMSECPDCNGTGVELEICCDSLVQAILNHCACKGRPQVKQDCERCNGTGNIEEG